MAKRPKDSDVIFSKCSQLCTITYRGKYKLIQHINAANDLNEVFRFKDRKKYRNPDELPHYKKTSFM